MDYKLKSEEEVVIFRNLQILLFINSKSSLKEKATALFYLNDLNANDTLEKDEFNNLIYDIFRLIGNYSVLMADFDETELYDWKQKLAIKVLFPFFYVS